MKNLVIVSFPAKEGRLDDLKETLKSALPDTRSFDGCISVDTYVEDATNTVHLIEDWESLDDIYLNSRTQGFGDEVTRRILIGTYVLSAGYYDAYYRQAQKVRRLIKDDFQRVFNEVDFILTPTTPNEAFKIGDKLDPISMYKNDIYTVPTSLAGLPGISIPSGLSSNGLPLGIQLIGNYFKEKQLLQLAALAEKELAFNE